MRMLSSLRKDYIASHLRSQLNTLLSVLQTIEDSELIEDDYTDESLKRVEINIRRLRRECRG
jgi:hypothetical protein